MNKIKKKIFFLGGIMSKELVNECLEKSISYDIAADNFQKKFIQGLPGDTIYINAPFMNYSNDRRMNSVMIEKSGVIMNKKKYLNLKYVNIITKYYALASIIKTIDFNNSIIICYALHSPFLRLLNKIKNKFNVKIIQIVPDLPQFMNTSSQVSCMYKLFKYIDMKYMDKLLYNVDLFVPFTLPIYSDYLIKYGKKYYVMEGISTLNRNNKSNIICNHNRKTVVYAGTLNRKYGVENLIKAFHYIHQENIQLIICGDGELKEYLLTSKFTNITYRGILNSEDVRKLIDSADLLVNPREDVYDFTKYSCPSKLFEYLSSGNEIICYKLSGVPDEYDQFLNYFTSNKPEYMAKDILNVLNKDIKKNNSIDLLNSKTAQCHVKNIFEIVNNI